jgi:protein subunit release factor A
MFDRLAEVERRYDELTGLMSDPEIATDPARLLEFARERAEIDEVVGVYRDLRAIEAQIVESEQLAREDDPEMAALARDEIDRLRAEREPVISRLRSLLVPRDPNDEKDVIVEIRAGAGGDEAALFAAELLRMYTRYAERQGWRVDLINVKRSSRCTAAAPIATCAMRAACIASSACRSRNPAAESTPRPRPLPCCLRWKMSTCRSTTTSCASMCSARPATAGRASTPPTPRCASRICRPGWS